MRPHALLRRGHVAISQQKHQWRRVPDVPRASRSMTASPPTPAEAPEIDIAAKTVQTAVGPLPLSPIMDPSFHEARQRWRTPKPKPAAQGRQRWQRILARNPFAQALASNIRRSNVTETTLPSFFLQRFDLVQHPDSKKVWWVPADLAPYGVRGDAQGGSESSSTTTQPRFTQKGPRAFILARKDLLAALQSSKSKYGGMQYRLAMNRKSQSQPELKKAVWREDMDDLVLDLMRRRIVDELIYLSSLRCADGSTRGYIMPCEKWDDIARVNHRGCVLLLKADQAQEDAAEGSSTPPRLSIMDMPTSRYQKKLLVHNLDMLLSPEHVDRLRRESAITGDRSLYVLRGVRTMSLQLKLWKLQQYMPN